MRGVFRGQNLFSSPLLWPWSIPFLMWSYGVYRLPPALLVPRLDYFSASEPEFMPPLTIAEWYQMRSDRTGHQGCFSAALIYASGYAYNFLFFFFYSVGRSEKTSAFNMSWPSRRQLQAMDCLAVLQWHYTLSSTAEQLINCVNASPPHPGSSEDREGKLPSVCKRLYRLPLSHELDFVNV